MTPIPHHSQVKCGEPGTAQVMVWALFECTMVSCQEYIMIFFNSFLFTAQWSNPRWRGCSGPHSMQFSYIRLLGALLTQPEETVSACSLYFHLQVFNCLAGSSLGLVQHVNIFLSLGSPKLKIIPGAVREVSNGEE